MGLKKFDRKLGLEFIASLPAQPGIYLVYNVQDQLIYIGKAKNLKRRLSQYRNAKRRKKHYKMRAIIHEAARIETRLCANDFEACCLEMRLIQENRPKWNTEGAFYFLYPLLGMKWEGGFAHFCYTTEPERFPGFDFHGAFRSRYLTREAFFAWMELLGFVGHRMREKREGLPRYSYCYRFRQISEGSLKEWGAFWKGESLAAAETLTLALIENAGARRASKEVQDGLDALKRFWRFEAQLLQRARKAVYFPLYPVPQRERDLLFIKFLEFRKTRDAKKTHTTP